MYIRLIISLVLLIPSLSLANYSVMMMDPEYQIEEKDPNHHWAPRLNEALEEYKERFNQDVGPEFFQWVSVYKQDMPKVHYFTHKELQKIKQKFIAPNRVVNAVDETPHEAGMKMYVMTPEGEFFVHQKIKPKPGMNGFNHSSFFHGGPLSSVGFFHFNEQGELVGIDNYSGHYKPTIKDTVNAMHALQKNGIDLSKLDYNHRIDPLKTDKEVQNAAEWFNAHKNEMSEPKKPLQILAALNMRIIKNNLKGALIVGGGIAYESKNYIEGKTNDIDGMFIFESRETLVHFLKNNTQENIQRIFGFDDNFVPFTPDEVEYFLKNDIPVMRVAGFMDGLKITVKLTDFDSLGKLHADTAMPVLSKLKDKRKYLGKSLRNDTVDIFLINKTLTPYSDEPAFVILDRNYYIYNDTLIPGLATDFLVTAKAFRDYNGKFYDLQKKLRLNLLKKMELYGCLHPEETPAHILVRYNRFSDTYKVDFDQTLKSMMEKDKIKIEACKRAKIEDGYILSYHPQSFSAQRYSYVEPVGKSTAPPLENLVDAIQTTVSKKLHKNEEINVLPLTSEELLFSSNPLVGMIFVGAPTDDNPPKYFYKSNRTDDQDSVLGEINALYNLEQLYPKVVRPVYVDNKYRFFIQPFFIGLPMSALLTEDFAANADLIHQVELKKAEELLTGYLSSLSQGKFNSQNERIHQLYYKRLTGERINNYYYNQDITLPDGQIMNFNELQTYSFEINGKSYPSLETLIANAKEVLDPKFLTEQLKIYGFADNHAGNVLVNKDTGKYITVDYEYAGLAHPSQDLAKMIYNDVYFDILFPDTANNKYKVSVSIDKESKKISIDHDFALNRERQILYDIKVKGILMNFLDHAKSKGYDIERWDDILKSSLFGAGMLNKNVFKQGLPGWLALAVVVQLSSDDTTAYGVYPTLSPQN